MSEVCILRCKHPSPEKIMQMISFYRFQSEEVTVFKTPLQYSSLLVESVPSLLSTRVIMQSSKKPLCHLKKNAQKQLAAYVSLLFFPIIFSVIIPPESKFISGGNQVPQTTNFTRK